jgi:hypothetical protein
MSDIDDHLDDTNEPTATSDQEAQEHQPQLAQVLGTVVPIHAATGKIKRGPGRPKKIRTEPTRDDLIYHAEMMRQKTAFIDADPLVKSSSERQEAIETLQRVKTEIAKESAALHFQRIEEEKYGKDTSQMSSRRIAALREVAHLELEIRRLGETMIDLKGEKFQKIFALLLETVKSAAEEVLSPEMIGLLFNRLETKLEGWEEKAQSL